MTDVLLETYHNCETILPEVGLGSGGQIRADKIEVEELCRRDDKLLSNTIRSKLSPCQSRHYMTCTLTTTAPDFVQEYCMQ